MLALGHQVRATSCGGRPSAACTHALGRITLHAASSRRLAALRINACAASSQGGTPRKRGCAASRRQPAAPAEAEAAPASAAASGAAGRKERTSASLSALQAFVALHKRLPGRRDEIDGIRVGVWLNTQRIAYRRHLLQPELVAALEALPGWTWDPLKDEPVEEKFLSTLSSLKAFVALEGRQPTRTDEKFEGIQLGEWVMTQRCAYNKGELQPERVAALEAVPGFPWDPLGENWSENLEALRAFVAEKGALPTREQQHDGCNVGTWVRTQRRAYKDDKLDPERVAVLEAVPGFCWDAKHTAWLVKVEELRALVAKKGALPTAQDKPRGRALVEWVLLQRKLHKEGKLAPDRVAALDALAVEWRSSSSRR